MRFKNIPVYFDAQGRAHLRGERWVEPFMIFQREKPIDVAPRDGSVCDFDVDPMTRVGGALSLHTVVDLEKRQVVDAFVETPLFRGFELVLQRRELGDAVHLSSRACGLCGCGHAICSALAGEMVVGAPPPPLALVVRNLGQGAELVADHLLHLFLLSGPDYSEKVVRRTTPTLWARAEKTDAANDSVHGQRTMADLMRSLNSPNGQLVLEALQFARIAREVTTLMFGKVPHPSTVYPAGLGIEPSASLFNQVFGRVVKLLDYAKKVVAVWNDVVDFFYAEAPGSQRVGERQVNLLSTGLWDDPDAYDASFTTCAQWGEERLATPGVIVNGELRTTHLDAVNLGVEEFVDHSYYRAWDGHRFPTDPLGAPLSPFNPWNKQTIPQPSRRNWKEKYTWSTAPRWDRVPMETGPLARQWITALARRLKSEFIRSVPGGLEIDLPRGETPAVTLTWQIPKTANALERNRARAYHVAYAGMAAYAHLLKAFQYLRQGQTAMSTPYVVPSESAGIGFWESARGAMTHYVEVKDGRIANYQMLTPSTWTASPRDLFGVPGPVEEAVINTPILEEFERPEEFTGIDILRAIRSFDPCMSCAVH